MTEVKHPRALAIAKRGDSAAWDMGDYLLEVSGKQIEEVSAELIEHGYSQYTVYTMSALRRAAQDFSPDERVTGIGWATHQAAGNHTTLQACIAAAKAQDRKVSTHFVRQVMNGMEADKRAKRKGVEIKARKAADRAEAKGDKKAAERHRSRARKLKGAPKRDRSKTTVPKTEDVPLMVIKAKFMADSADAVAMVKRMDREITPHIDDLTKAFIVGSVEELLEIAEAFRKLAAKLQRNQSNKRAHLHAVA